MLARENRIRASADFRSAVKGGLRANTTHLVVYLKRVQDQTSARFGFIVGKNVGGAVQRNLVKRRLRALAKEQLQTLASDADYVVRAQAGVADLDWNRLAQEFREAMQQVTARANR